jgi:hypothetical protein
MRQPYRYLSLLSLVWWFGPPSLSQARESEKPNPTWVAAIQETSLHYKQCQDNTLALAKKGAWQADAVRESLEVCRERYAAAGVYLSCKKQLLEKTPDPRAIQEGMKRCRALLVEASFNPETPQPVFLYEGNAFFAGVGMNQPLDLRNGAPPGFTCENLTKSFEKPSEVQYSLFGNHIELFEETPLLPAAQIQNYLLTQIQPASNGVLLLNYGKIFGALSEKNAIVYFPTGTCTYTRPLGNLYKAITLYYLLDQKAQKAIAYLGVAFFSEQRVVQQDVLERVSSLVQQRVGRDFQVIVKNPTTTFLAAGAITEFDGQGDPLNICKKPRIHDMLFALHGDPHHDRTLSYLLFANVKNLCAFGDSKTKLLLQPLRVK